MNNLLDIFDKRYVKFEKKFNKVISNNVNQFRSKIELVLVGKRTSPSIKFCGYHLCTDYDDHQILMDLLVRWGKNYSYEINVNYSTYNSEYFTGKCKILQYLSLNKIKED